MSDSTTGPANLDSSRQGAKETMTKQDFIDLGGKEWMMRDMERVYISAEIFNRLYNTSFGDNNNKFYFDCKTKAVMRCYKGKRPILEISYA